MERETNIIVIGKNAVSVRMLSDSIVKLLVVGVGMIVMTNLKKISVLNRSMNGGNMLTKSK